MICHRWSVTPQGYGKVADRLTKQIIEKSKGDLNTTGFFLEISTNDIYHAFQGHKKTNSDYPGSMDMSVDELIYAISNINNGEVITAKRYSSGDCRVNIAIPLCDGYVVGADVYSKSTGSLRVKTRFKMDKKSFEAKYKSSSDSRSDYNSQQNYLRSDTASELNISSDNNNVNKSLKVDITQGMSDEQRYEKLKDLNISIVMAKAVNLDASKIDELKNTSITKAQKSLKQLGVDLGIIRSRYYNQTIDVDFRFTSHSLKESTHKQSNVKFADKYIKFAEMLNNFDSVIKNAVLIERHSDRYEGGKRYDPDLKQVYVLVSGFEDEEGIVPVKLEVKEFDKKENNLYVTITMPTIKKARIEETEMKNTPHVSSQAFYTYKLADLLHSVKNDPYSESLGKYIPKQFLIDAKSSSNVDNEVNVSKELL